jgi:nucleoside-diphosphate-sugar epimerase
VKPASASDDLLIDRAAPVLVTGAAGFIGSRVVDRLLARGFRDVRCLVRPSSSVQRLQSYTERHRTGRVTIVLGNLLSRDDCRAAVRDAAVVFHLAAVRGEKSFPDAFLNTVVTTRNLLDSCVAHGGLRRFVSISSFSVYANRRRPKRLLDETAPIDARPERRSDPYCYAKVKQDLLVRDYGERFGVPWVIVRPGFVYGAGNEGIPGRVGLSTFGLFLHLGGANPIPMTFVDNCAEAIVLAGVRPGVDRQVFNVVDDDLPTSREFLRRYKRQVRRFRSIYLPHAVSYLLSMLWEKYSAWSEGQLPPVYNRAQWHTYWKKTRYTNAKLKAAVGWTPIVPTSDALQRFFESCRANRRHA